MRKIFVFLFLSVVLVSAAMADTIVYPIGQASTDSFVQGAGVGMTPRGWDFVVSQPIYVQQLGINAAFELPITMSLWDATTQTLLGQTTVNAQPYGWAFADLAGAIQLTPGDTYSVIGWADTTNYGQAWYIYNNTPPSEFNPTGIVTYLNGRYDNGIDANTFPLGTLSAPAQYGVADIGYTLVPEPGTLALIGTGLGLVGVLRRKLNF
jgi:hypothetical protein